MIETVEKALYPLRLASFIVGSGIYRNRLNHAKRFLSISYIFILWIIYMCLFNYVLIFTTLGCIFFRFIQFFMVTMNLLVTFISIIITFHRQKEFEICIKKLNLVDDTLEKLGTPKEYHKMHNLIKWMLFIWFAIVITTNTFDGLWSVKLFNNKMAVLVPFVMTYAFHTNTLMDIMFAFLLRHIHSELCRIARDINELFGIQMSLQMMSCFVVLTGIIFFQYYTLLHAERLIYQATLEMFLCSDIWFVVLLTKLISLNHICESVSSKAQKIKGLIHRLTNLARFAEARDEIQQFVLQVSLRPLKFNGMGLFYFGYNFIHKFFVQVLTFIIIMVQTNVPPVCVDFENIFNMTYNT